MQLKAFILVLFLFWANFTFAQSIDLYVVNIRGMVTSADGGEPVAYAHIINPRAHGGTTTNADGMFSIQMLTEDTLTIRALGFVDEKLIIEEFPPKKLYKIVLKPVRILIDEVTVTKDLEMRRRLGLPDPEPLNIPTELRGDAFNERPPWFAAFLSPISFVQYHTSKREKEKREVRKIIKNNEEWLTFSNYHNLDNIKRLTGLDDNEADKFMMYCNLNNKLPYFAGQIEIEFQIMDFYFKYKKLQAE
ncbi:MAG: carboxypeptidase-like regulatory domain-containing protein [Prolixibacteraceae bacterium]|jgi:hypothetical protein|nr:carboxypeptidase-like regulatory domain-containing protein [Prolixibacteraceae bacterium]